MDVINDEKDESNSSEIINRAGKGNPFSVPDTYFNQLHACIESQIALHARISDLKPFSLPENYFETLTEQVEGRIFTETLKDHVSEPSFSVPPGYFEVLEQSIILKTSEAKTEKSVKIRPLSSWVSYAAAACLTIALSVGLYVKQQGSSIDQRMSELPESEILSYLQQYNETGDTELILEHLDTKDLDLDFGSSIPQDELKSYLENTL